MPQSREPHSSKHRVVGSTVQRPQALGLLLGWTAPDGVESARMRSSKSHTREPSGHQGDPNWHRHVQECFSAAWSGCGGESDLAQKAAAPAVSCVRREVGPNTNRSGSLWRSASLGWKLSALGHEIVLLPPQYVKPYVKRGKHDAADAEAICEAMSRPSMRFVPVKTAEQQAALMLAGTRDQLVRRRTQLTNTIRGYAAESGLAALERGRQDRAAAGAGCERCGFARACEGAVRRIPR